MSVSTRIIVGLVWCAVWFAATLLILTATVRARDWWVRRHRMRHATRTRPDSYPLTAKQRRAAQRLLQAAADDTRTGRRIRSLDRKLTRRYGERYQQPPRMEDQWKH